MGLILFSSCSINETTLSQKEVSKKIYTEKEYKLIFQDEIQHHDEATYIGLTFSSLKLLNQPFQKATLEEINNDIAYNRESLKLDREYMNSIEFFKETKNLFILSMHLKYQLTNIKSIVYKENKAIISFIKATGSYESFLIYIDKNIMKIKLIDYMYA